MADKLKVDVDARVVERRVLELSRRYPEATATAVYQEGVDLLAESIPEVPVDTGRLRRSGYVDAPSSAYDPVCMVGYGTEYALAVHERREVNHATGKAGYLIDPMLRRAAGYPDRMARRIAKNVRDGVTLGDVAAPVGRGRDDE